MNACLKQRTAAQISAWKGLRLHPTGPWGKKRTYLPQPIKACQSRQALGANPHQVTMRIPTRTRHHIPKSTAKLTPPLPINRGVMAMRQFAHNSPMPIATCLSTDGSPCSPWPGTGTADWRNVEEKQQGANRWRRAQISNIRRGTKHHRNTKGEKQCNYGSWRCANN